MRRSILCASLLFLLWPSALLGQSDIIRLDTLWKFSPKDDESFSRPDLVDDAWARISVGRSWESQGFPGLDGVVWYRVRVRIPSSLRDRAPIKEGLKLFLGKVDDIDQVFLNGGLIGSNGTSIAFDARPAPARITSLDSRWDQERVYTISYEDPNIRWDSDNVIAVRVYDSGGPGGMWHGFPTLRPVSIGDLLQIDRSASSFMLKNGTISKTIVVRNLSAVIPMKGTVSVRTIDGMTGEEQFHTDLPLDLSPGASSEHSYSLPSPQQSLIVEYRTHFTGHTDLLSTREEVPYLLTPSPPETPRINGPSVVGARPGRPFLYRIPVTGRRPLSFSVSGLPPGLTLDARSGIISGRTPQRGSYPIGVTAQNDRGKQTRTVTLKVGDKLALTPPMGWNSWNVWGLTVDQEKVVASARVFDAKGLADHGWAYINIDDGWEIKGDSPAPKRLGDGRIIVNEKFPDMKALGDSLHAMGLKFGIYSSPGPLTCGGYTASYQHERQDARSYAAWGIDYLKYDWCSYGRIAKGDSRDELMKPYTVMRQMLDEVDRDIVYSLCQYGMGDVWEWGASVGGDLWRSTGDINDTWASVRDIGFHQVTNAAFAGPGGWNDPDMLVVGWVGWGPRLHPTRLTPDEQYTHISLWCLLSAPLLIGCDLTRLDEFTLNLLTNDEVLAVDQDPLGKQATPILMRDSIQVWSKPLADGSRAIGIFNLSDGPRHVSLSLKDLELPDGVELRDLWRQKQIGRVSGEAAFNLPRHGVVLLKTGNR